VKNKIRGNPHIEYRPRKKKFVVIRHGLVWCEVFTRENAEAYLRAMLNSDTSVQFDENGNLIATKHEVKP
jgi:hypothetical protein